MFIHPFLAGVIVTIVAEIALLFVAAIIAVVRKVEYGD